MFSRSPWLLSTFGALIWLLSLAPTSPALAQEKPELVIYTYDAFVAEWGPAPKIKIAFEKECECTLKFVAADSSIGALRKIQLEGARTKADIVLGLDTNIAQAARKTGLFTEHGLNIKPLAIAGDTFAKWSDKHFVPFDFSYFAFVYNTRKISQVPTSFEELAAMPDDFKIIIQDPRSSTPGLGLLLWVKALHGDKANQIWKSLAPKILTITKGWSDAYGLFLKGEAQMVLSYTTSPAYHLIVEENSDYAAAKFDGGHYMQIEVAGIVKSSKNQKLARKFMTFMMGDEFQDIIPTTNWTYPAFATKAGLPKGFETLHIPEASILLEGKNVETHRKEWIDEWLSAIKN